MIFLKINMLLTLSYTQIMNIKKNENDNVLIAPVWKNDSYVTCAPGGMKQG